MNEIPTISSRDNQRLVNARKVRDRHETAKMFIEGRRLSIEALRSGLTVLECFVSERFVSVQENSELLQQISITARFVFELPDRVFKTIAATENSQGIILIAERPENVASEIEKRLKRVSGIPVVVVLDQINNPANLGAVLRSAEAAGAAGVIVTDGSADGFSAKAVRASMGAAFRLPMWQGVTFETALNWGKTQGLLATASSADSRLDHTALDWRQPRLLVIGSEAHGLGSGELSQIDEHVKIPMESPVESLNLAVVAGILLYEAKRQNG